MLRRMFSFSKRLQGHIEVTMIDEHRVRSTIRAHEWVLDKTCADASTLQRVCIDSTRVQAELIYANLCTNLVFVDYDHQDLTLYMASDRIFT